MANIVTVAEVLALTGLTVTDAQITQAQGIVGLKTGLDLDEVTWRTITPYARDQRNLRKAVAYQAAYVSVHPDVFTASDVSTSTADGASQTYTATGVVLAPLAKMALRRLSNQGTRSIHVEQDAVSVPLWNGAVSVPEWTDDTHPWVPLQ